MSSGIGIVRALPRNPSSPPLPSPLPPRKLFLSFLKSPLPFLDSRSAAASIEAASDTKALPNCR